jgi:glycosyltransferase involved in cell wall biosynthesis
VGGSANAALSLAFALRRAGLDVEVLSPVPSDLLPYLRKHPASALVRAIPYTHKTSLGVLLGMRSVWHLVSALRRDVSAWDVVHSHSGTFPYAFLPLTGKASSLRVHSLYCPIGAQGGLYGTWWERPWIAKVLLETLDGTFAMTPNVKRSLSRLGISPEKLLELPMCYDSGKFAASVAIPQADLFPKETIGYRLAFIGNASEEKGLSILLDALSILRNRDIPFYLVAALENANRVGELDRKRDQLERKLALLSLRSKVRFVGVIPDIRMLYREADIVVIPWISTRGPSDYPMTALEAMAMERCVVATPVGSCPELFQGSKAGILADDFSAESLANALGRALQSMDYRKAIAHCGRHASNRFSSEQVGRELVDAYESMIQAKRLRLVER